MARRNPQDTIATLRDDLSEKEELIDSLEDENDRLRGRLSRVAALTTDVLEESEIDGENDPENFDDEDDDD